jgi:23S rRNA pseudouridine1911/1915/1917 synthase
MPPSRRKAASRTGTRLDAAVRAQLDAPWAKARSWIETGKITVGGRVETDPGARVADGADIVLTMAAPRPDRGGRLDPSAIVFADAHVVVVHKPSGISTIPFAEGERGTLDELVRDYLSSRERVQGRPALGVVHRIDKETTGLVVFTRTWLAKKSLTAQFRAHTVHRRYLALAYGEVSSLTIRTHLVADRGDGLRGSVEAMRRRAAPNAFPDKQLAITHLERIESLRGATFLAARLETGRTHQIRVHLSESGHPLLGEKVYIRGFPDPLVTAPRLMLHAAELGFIHPATELAVRWEAPLPDDMKEVLQRLSSKK